MRETTTSGRINAPELLGELSEAASVIEHTAQTLDQWAAESCTGGWSTHQVDTQRKTADSLRRHAARYRAAIAAAEGR